MSDQILPSQTPAETQAPSQPSRPGLSSIGLGVGAAGADLVTVFGTCAFASLVYQQWTGRDGGAFDPALGIGVLASLFYAGAAWIAGLYHPRSLSHATRSVPVVLSLWTATCLSVTAILFLLKVGPNYSRATLSLFAGSAPLALILSRYLMSPLVRLLTGDGALSAPAMILIGDAEELQALTPRSLVRLGFRDTGRVIIEPGDDILEAAAQAIRLGRAAGARLFVVVAPWSDADKLTVLQDGLRASPLPVYLLPGQVLRAVIERRSWAEGMSVPLIELQRSPMTWAEQAGKRTFDLLIASMALVAVLPLLAATAPCHLQRNAGRRPVPPAARRARSAAFPDLQVPHHDGRGGRQQHRSGEARRPPCHPCGPPAPSVEHRRASAALQCHPGRHVAGRAAPARPRA